MPARREDSGLCSRSVRRDTDMSAPCADSSFCFGTVMNITVMLLLIALV